MCVTLNPRIKIAPIRAPSGLISYLLQNRAKSTPRAALWGAGRCENVRQVSFDKPQTGALLLLPPPSLSKKTPPNPDKFVYLPLGTKSDPFLDPSRAAGQSHQPRVLLREVGHVQETNPRNISSTLVIATLPRLTPPPCKQKLLIKQSQNRIPNGIFQRHPLSRQREKRDSPPRKGPGIKTRRKNINRSM